MGKNVPSTKLHQPNGLSFNHFVIYDPPPKKKKKTKKYPKNPQGPSNGKGEWTCISQGCNYRSS